MSYIKASSSCRIALQQKEELTPDMTQRTVTIMGSEEGILLAVRLMHLLINIPPRDIDILILTPFSMNSDLQFFLEQYPKSIITSEKGATDVDNTTAEVQVAESREG